MYLPELNPGYQFIDGKIIGNNEWSRMPPSEIRFREGRAPVKFELIEPDIKELISKQSFGVHFDRDLDWVSLSFWYREA